LNRTSMKDKPKGYGFSNREKKRTVDIPPRGGVSVYRKGEKKKRKGGGKSVQGYMGKGVGSCDHEERRTRGEKKGNIFATEVSKEEQNLHRSLGVVSGQGRERGGPFVSSKAR